MHNLQSILVYFYENLENKHYGIIFWDVMDVWDDVRKYVIV